MERLKALYNICLQGNATQAETKELSQLLTDPKNTTLATELVHNAFLANKTTLEDISPATAEAVLQVIFDTNHHRIHFIKTSWLRYAAAIILILGVGGYLWFNHTTSTPANPKNPINPNSDIAAGSNKAILTLSDGHTIELENKDNGKTLQQLAGADLTAGAGVFGKNSATSKMQSSAQPTRANEATAFNTITTPRGGQYQITLPDGTKVWLNAASSIKFPTAFASNERLVEITGESYLEVAQNKTKPFFVTLRETQGNKTTIQVLGTSFNVNAYTDEEDIKTTLIEGSIRVNKGNETTLLKPGEQAIINNSENAKIQKILIQTNNILAWKNGLFQFNKADIKTVMRQLSRWYDIEVSYEKTANTHEQIIGEMQRSLTLLQALKILENTGLHFRMEGRKIIVY